MLKQKNQAPNVIRLFNVYDIQININKQAQCDSWLHSVFPPYSLSEILVYNSIDHIYMYVYTHIFL